MVTDYRPIINIMTQIMTLGMLGPMIRGPSMVLQEGKKPTIRELEARILAVEGRIDALEGKPAKKPLFGGRKVAVPIVDTKTKWVYHSRSSAGKALAAEVGTTPEDHFAWYKLIARFPERFKEASPGEVERAKVANTYLQVD